MSKFANQIKVAKTPIQEFGAAIAFCRNQLVPPLRQKELADRCGVSHSVEVDWEMGRYLPKGRQWARLKGNLGSLRKIHHLWLAAGGQEEPEEELATPAKPPMLTIVPAPQEKIVPFHEVLVASMKEGKVDNYELADIIGLSDAAICKWTTGENLPTKENFEKLLALFPNLANITMPKLKSFKATPGKKTQQAITTFPHAPLPPAVPASIGFDDVSKFVKTTFENEKRASSALVKAQNEYAFAKSKADEVRKMMTGA